jgi:hypothetical protein
MQNIIKPGNKPQADRQGYKPKKLSKKFKRDRKLRKEMGLIS